MKTIDRTKPQVTSLELSRKISEALEGIGVRVETYWWWCKHKKERYKIINLDYIVRYEPSYVSEIPAYQTDDLMALLPQIINENYRFITTKSNGGYSVYYLMEDCNFNLCVPYDNSIDDKSLPEALGKLLVYLIEEEIIKESYDN